MRARIDRTKMLVLLRYSDVKLPKQQVIVETKSEDTDEEAFL